MTKNKMTNGPNYISDQLVYYPGFAQTGKVLKYERLFCKFLKIESAFKSAGELFSDLEKYLNFTIFLKIALLM